MCTTADDVDNIDWLDLGRARSFARLCGSCYVHFTSWPVRRTFFEEFKQGHSGHGKVYGFERPVMQLTLRAVGGSRGTGVALQALEWRWRGARQTRLRESTTAHGRSPPARSIWRSALIVTNLFSPSAEWRCNGVKEIVCGPLRSRLMAGMLSDLIFGMTGEKGWCRGKVTRSVHSRGS